MRLLIGGSPCQGFSFAGKQLNFGDPRSKLFFEYVRILEEYKPDYFLLENVKMKKEYQDIISSYLGVEPIEINSALVSAQNRKRMYWTNIPNASKPIDKGVLLKDILEDLPDCPVGIAVRKKSNCVRVGGGNLPFGSKQIWDSPFQRISKKGKVKISLEKSACLTGGAHSGGNHSDMDIIHTPYATRRYSVKECERLQTVPDNYTFGGLSTRFQKCCHNGNEWKGYDLCKNVESKDVISQSQVGKLNSAISTILDLLETEHLSFLENLLIKAKSVSSKGVKESNKQLRVTALLTTNSGLEKTQKLHQNVRFVVKKLDTLDGGGCAYVMQLLRIDTETQEELMKMKLENFNLMAMKKENTIKQKVVNGYIKKLQKKYLEENCDQEKLYIMLTLINLIISLAIFMCVKTTQVTSLCIDSLNVLQGNLLEMELLCLEMENIEEISNASRYKMLGNGWTVDVIAHIFRNLPDKEYEVLSLFDGMSCGQLALKRANKSVSKYMASEVDKYAMKVTQANFPNTVQLGDVRDILCLGSEVKK